MKRFLSVTLCVMMIASLFAVNVSAYVPEGYIDIVGAVDEIVYINQDFSDETKTDFTTRISDGAISVSEDGVMHMTGNYASCYYMNAGATSAIGSGEYVMEFDFMRNDNLNTDYQIHVTIQRAANASSTNANLKRYGVTIPVRTVGMYEDEDGVRYEDAVNPCVDIVAKKWYNFRLTVSESAFVTAGGTEDNGPLNALMKVERKLATESNWTTLNHNTYNHFIESVCRKKGTSSMGAGTNEVALTVQTDGYGQTIPAYAYKYNEETETYVKEDKKLYPEDARDADFQFDNIKVYTPAVAGTPVTRTYPIKGGAVYTLDFDANDIKVVPSCMTKKTADNNSYVEISGIESGYQLQDIVTTTDLPDAMVATVDLCSTVAGLPIWITLGKAVYGTTTNSTPVLIKGNGDGIWYTYKITGPYVNGTKLYRKVKGAADSTYVELVNGVDWKNYSNTAGKNTIRFGMFYDNNIINAEYGTLTTEQRLATRWLLDNLQVYDGAAVSGSATVSGSTITATLNVAAPTDAASSETVTPIVAVYDGTMLKNLGTATVNGEGTVDVVCEDYASGNKVMLYIWNTLANGKPVLKSALDITNNL